MMLSCVMLSGNPAFAQETGSKVAGAADMAPVQEVTDEGLEPVLASAIEPGEYDIAFIFTDGIARGKFTITPKSEAKTPDKPSKDDKNADTSKQGSKAAEGEKKTGVKTGDDQNFIGYLMLLLAAGTLAAALRKRERK